MIVAVGEAVGVGFFVEVGIAVGVDGADSDVGSGMTNCSIGSSAGVVVLVGMTSLWPPKLAVLLSEWSQMAMGWVRRSLLQHSH